MKKLLLSATLLFAFCNSSFAQCHPDFDALMALYNATDGPNWVYNDGWEEGATGNDCDVCEWDYVQCNNNDRVTSLSMYSNGGPGVIPSEIGDIQFLEYLNLSYWDLTGQIPASIGLLTNLKGLHLTDNELTGSIPTSIGNLINLEDLYLNQNDLTGSLPSGLANMTQLKKLFIHDTDISGSIPSGMGDMPNIEWIEMSNNQLTGFIPSDWGNLTNIGELDLSNNNLTGSIPATFGQLSNVFYIGLDNNDLSGCIPNELSAICGNSFITVDLYNNSQLPNGGDFDAFCTNNTGACDPVSTKDLELPKLEIFPNPASEQLTINSKAFQIDQVQLTTLVGQTVLNQQFETSNELINVDIQHLPVGLYFVTALEDGLKVAQSKLVIR